MEGTLGPAPLRKAEAKNCGYRNSARAVPATLRARWIFISPMQRVCGQEGDLGGEGKKTSSVYDLHLLDTFVT